MQEKYKRYLEREEYDPLDPAKQHDAKTSSELVKAFLNKKISSGLSLTSKAYVKWCEVAGSRAASHTMAVWVNDKNPHKDPELVVYLDTNTLIADYTTNAEIYIDRLLYADFPISKLTFRLSNKVRQTQQSLDSQEEKEEELPELSSSELQEIEVLCSNLSPNLKASASRAMELSLRRQKLEDTRNIKPTP